MRHRFYDAAQRRFISPDPLGIDDLLEREEILNLFAYARDNPLWFSDPLGLWQVTLGAGYGYAGRVSFGRNQGRWNVRFGFGYGLGLLFSFSPEDIDPQYASHRVAAHIGVEISAAATIEGLHVSGGLQGRIQADQSNRIDTRVGGFGSLRIPGSPVDVGGSAAVVARTDLNQMSGRYLQELRRTPVEIGFGGMVFGGFTGGISWGTK